MTDPVRCFVAVDIDREIRTTVGVFLETLRREFRGIKWVKPDNLHLTLKFLGNVEPGAVEGVGAALDNAVNGRTPFTLNFSGAGLFPDRGSPRVLWIGVTAGAEEMTALGAAVEESLSPLGFPPESRPFTPHLTIGRVKNIGTPRMLAEAMADAADIGWGESVVDRIHLVRSELFPSGPRYSILHDARFAR